MKQSRSTKKNSDSDVSRTRLGEVNRDGFFVWKVSSMEKTYPSSQFLK